MLITSDKETYEYVWGTGPKTVVLKLASGEENEILPADANAIN